MRASTGPTARIDAWFMRDESAYVAGARGPGPLDILAGGGGEGDEARARREDQEDGFEAGGANHGGLIEFRGILPR
jgi:hypothetical protein